MLRSQIEAIKILGLVNLAVCRWKKGDNVALLIDQENSRREIWEPLKLKDKGRNRK